MSASSFLFRARAAKGLQAFFLFFGQVTRPLPHALRKEHFPRPDSEPKYSSTRRDTIFH
jgi:hypothetical protein